ncbi:DUF4340 domain-containing protein [Pseudomonas indica]|uniref:DUF4340 domain-containing protein n=1 Tax=Pseudomonas indica TaxID=137658 RepID=UPI0023F86C10|nr:DUF4340 domain-containing protein [Pseudomonas indica]MBU3057699.1 DUF4340 domain-containing protein [Pseudomonas indica]
MGRRSLSFLALLAAALLIAFFWLQREPQPVATAQEPLLPMLQGKFNEVSAIEIQRPGQPLVRLARKDGVWVVPAKSDYPAAGQPLAELLRALSEARKVEAKTRNPEFHGRLGVAEQGKEDEQATRVTLERGTGEPVRLLIGKAAPQGRGQMVRLAGDPQVWLVNQSIEMPANELAWLDRRVTVIPFGDIREFDLRHAGGEQLTLFRESKDEPNLKVRQMPQGQRLAYEAVANGMVMPLSRLDFAEAAPLAQVQFKGKPELEFTLATFAGGRLKGAVYAQGGEHWLTLPEREGLSEAEVPAKADWTYRLEPYQYQAMAKKLKDLLPEKTP